MRSPIVRDARPILLYSPSFCRYGSYLVTTLFSQKKSAFLLRSGYYPTRYPSLAPVVSVEARHA